MPVRDKKESISLVEWLGFLAKPNLSHAVWLGPVFGALLSLLILTLITSFICVVVKFTFTIIGYNDVVSNNTSEAVRNYGLVLIAFFSAPFVVWRAMVASKQASIAEASLFNEKMSSAARNLSARREVSRVIIQNDGEVVLNEWKNDLVTRAAAVDNLEGLVDENPKLSPRVVRLLATYIRGNFPCDSLEPSPNITERAIPHLDLQKAVSAIGAILPIAYEIDDTKWRLDLRGCNFDGVDLSAGFFKAVDFSGSRFEASIFNQGNFEGSRFNGCLLNYSDFIRANFKGAALNRVILNRPEPQAGGFVKSVNMANLEGVTFIAADISALDYLGKPEEISKTFATLDTKLSPNVKARMLSDEDHSSAHLYRSLRNSESFTEKENKLIQRLESTGFQHWSPYESSDLTTGHLLVEFYEELNMKHWPYYG